MFKKNVLATLLTCAALGAQATENLSVLVVYDQDTIDATNGPSELNSTYKKLKYSRTLISNLNETISNSALSSHLNFNLTGMVTSSINTSNGAIPDNIKQIESTYDGYYTGMLNSGSPIGKAYELQDEYDADVVIVLVQEDESNLSGVCGKATHIPQKKPSMSVNYAAFSLFFIQASSECMGYKWLAAHEFGHTAGLNHGQITDDHEDYTKDVEPFMLKPGAAGYNYIRTFEFDFRTVMTDKPIFDQLLNRFSDSERNDCDGAKPCGDGSANAVATLKAFAASYNQRGDWFDTH